MIRTLAAGAARLYGRRVWRAAILLAGIAVLAATGARAQEADPPAGEAPAEEAAAEADGHAEAAGEPAIPDGPILLGGVSVPVLQGTRVRLYAYGLVALIVNDTPTQLGSVCSHRFDLVDEMLTYLHTHPFPTGTEQDGPAAIRELLAIAKRIVGPNIVIGLDVRWSQVPLQPSPTVFGNNQSVPCREGDAPPPAEH